MIWAPFKQNPMTVISRSLNHMAPVIASDLLISAEGSHNGFIPPTMEDQPQDFVNGLRYKPVTLAQKIYLLTDTICIALAGKVYEMRQLLDDLAMYCRIIGSPTAEQMRTYLREYGLDQLTGCAFFMLVIERDQEGMIHATEISLGDFQPVDSEMMDRSTAIGSGADDFNRIISQNMHFETSFPDGDIRQSVVKHGSLIAHLLVLERATRSSLRNAWGGGFEFAVYDGKKFVKPDNVAYIINYGYIDANDRFEMPMPMVVLHHRYVGEILVITKVLWKNHLFNATDSHYILSSNDIEVNIFIVPSIKTGITIPADLDTVHSFETAWIGMGYLVNTHDKISLMPSFFTGSVDLQVIFDAGAKTIEIRMRNQMTELLQDMVTKGVWAIRRLPETGDNTNVEDQSS